MLWGYTENNLFAKRGNLNGNMIFITNLPYSTKLADCPLTYFWAQKIALISEPPPPPFFFFFSFEVLCLRLSRVQNATSEDRCMWGAAYNDDRISKKKILIFFFFLNFKKKGGSAN